jgi:hypothetical protein
VDSLELSYRRTPRNPVVLRSYVRDLIERQHILEATFFYERLKKEDATSFETNRMGYLLSIRMMDPKVGDFDKRLIEAGATQEQLYALHLHYYYTFSHIPKMRECMTTLLNIEPTEQYTFAIITEAVIALDDFDLAAQFIQYFLPRLKSTDELIKRLRRILIKHFHRLLKAMCNK